MANNLIEMYLNLYSNLTKSKTLDTKMMTSLLVGVHRAYPYSKMKNDLFEQHLQTLYTLVHQVNFRMRVVAMVLIKNIVSKRAQLLKCPIEDRFYNLVFGQLIEPDLQICSRQDAFINLLLSVINEDTVVERKEAFVKRMLQVALNSQHDLALKLMTAISKIKGYNADLCVNNLEEKHENVDEEDENLGSWVHRQSHKPNKKCDLLARNPRAARPDNYFEYYLLKRSYDPPLAQAAQTLIKN